MDRAEATGLGIAFAGHAALFALLTLGFASTQLPKLEPDPIEVSFVDEVALQSTSPSTEAPAPLPAEVEGPPEAAAEPVAEPLPAPVPEPAPPQPQPRPAPPPKPTPQPRPAPQPKPQPKPAPQRPQPKASPAPSKTAPKAATKATTKASPKAATRPPARPGNAARPTGRLNNLNLPSDSPGAGKAAAPPAKVASAAAQASLARAIVQQLRPHWKSPTGADVELLRTTVTVNLSRSGAVTSIGAITTTGQTASNRSQVKLHQEQAVRAVRLAAPFDLPDEYYDAWKVIKPNFDRRLSQ